MINDILCLVEDSGMVAMGRELGKQKLDLTKQGLGL